VTINARGGPCRSLLNCLECTMHARGRPCRVTVSSTCASCVSSGNACRGKGAQPLRAPQGGHTAEREQSSICVHGHGARGPKGVKISSSWPSAPSTPEHIRGNSVTVKNILFLPIGGSANESRISSSSMTHTNQFRFQWECMRWGETECWGQKRARDTTYQKSSGHNTAPPANCRF